MPTPRKTILKSELKVLQATQVQVERWFYLDVGFHGLTRVISWRDAAPPRFPDSRYTERLALDGID